MSEHVPGYGHMPDLPMMDVRLLRSEIAMYLHSSAGEPCSRKLLEHANLSLERLERALYELEQLKS